jgi:hypothetical protein
MSDLHADRHHLAIEQHRDQVADEDYRDMLAEALSRCPVCGDVIDYCQGHGPIGDPVGARILAAHDDGDHDRCHPDAGCDHII